MSTPAITESGVGPERRVRHQARDVAALMAFSATISVGLSLALLLLMSLAG